MAYQFTQQVAEFLAQRHNDECRDDIRHGIEFEYRAKRLGNGQWCVWCEDSDHYVEFDQLGNGTVQS
jgi:mannose/cellobiose epimerase-like protein (N-acyl-D-glucosamine 2-epimerase family)